MDKKNKQTVKSKNGPEADAMEKFKQITAELSDLAQQAKKKFENADPATKKKIVGGIAGAAAAIVAAIGIKKMWHKKK